LAKTVLGYPPVLKNLPPFFKNRIIKKQLEDNFEDGKLVLTKDRNPLKEFLCSHKLRLF